MIKALHMFPDKCTSCLMCEMACSLENEGLFNPGMVSARLPNQRNSH